MAASAVQPLIVVCGAQGALGESVVDELVAAGHPVVEVGRSGAGSRSDRAGVLASLRADLASQADVELLWARIDELGGVGGLVNVAGAFAGGALTSGPAEAYRQMLTSNLDTTWWSCREGGRRLARSRGGAIVNVASRTAVAGGAEAAAYSVAKAAVLRLTEVLAAELSPSHVRVNAILPGVIDTAANRRAMSEAAMRGAVPPAAIAKVVRFLVSEEGWPVSGAAVPVCGWS